MKKFPSKSSKSKKKKKKKRKSLSLSTLRVPSNNMTKGPAALRLQSNSLLFVDLHPPARDDPVLHLLTLGGLHLNTSLPCLGMPKIKDHHLLPRGDHRLLVVLPSVALLHHVHALHPPVHHLIKEESLMVLVHG